ncbi:MAG TPA: type II toxin-antitoxin system HicA family toxin [Verrucomicrobiota bacterium]|nr:type II toxin-antitoxin system HicA family toxin [Verrucomicrobiota bacterium]HPY29335.1 type II toxin-antitoxin system HicA family toxin [Verrucomicrobiota bacterium]HQB15918.1 type II toxin-antitoxin system HicA family toxin [Verrucomicrobiota bacterium]
MKVPRDLSGAQLIKVLCRDWSYRQVNQEGSHVILQTETPGHQRLSIPNHNPLRVGTLNAIVRAVAAHKNVDRQTIFDSLR